MTVLCVLPVCAFVCGCGSGGGAVGEGVLGGIFELVQMYSCCLCHCEI